MVRSHDERVLGRDSSGDGLPHHPVDVARVGDVVGVTIVGAERDAPRSVLLDEWEQRTQVPRHRRLADKQPDPGTQTLAPFLDGQRLVVGADARGRVRLQVGPEHARRMPVDVTGAVRARASRAQQGEPSMTPGKFIISASPRTRRRRMSDSRSPAVSGTPRRLERRGGYARRRHEVDVELETCARVEQPVHPVDAEDVRDLVRIGDDGGRPEREDEPRELVDHELDRLEVHVRVDEAGHDVAPGRIERLAPSIAPEPGDDAVDDSDVGIEPLAREDRQDASPSHDEVGRLVSSSDCEATLQPFHRRQRNARRAVV